MQSFTLRAAVAALLLALVAPSCSNSALESGGGGNPAQAGDGTLDLVLRPTLVPELFGFSAVLDELRLVQADGTRGENLLADPLPLELLHLAETHAWLTRAVLAKDAQYASVNLSFVPGSWSALGPDGAPLQVDALVNVLSAPIVGGMRGPDYARLEILFDLRESLTLDLAQQTALLDPRGDALFDEGLEPLDVDLVLGIVRQRDTGTGRIELDAFASQDLAAPIGRVSVQVGPFARLVNINNQEFLNTAFFLTFLTPGSTLIDVAGSLGAGGELLARRVELEDQVPQIGGVFPVMLEGRVLEVTNNFSIRLQLRDIPRGRQLVQPYLDGLADPRTLLITYDPTLGMFFVGEDQLVSPADLAVGQDLSIKFRSFQGEPFPSWRMDISSSEPGFPGVVSDVSGLPQSFELESDTLGGLTILLDEALLLLDTFGLPQLAPEELTSGLRVVVNGVPPQGSGAPAIAASLVRVLPGRLLEARVSGSEPLTRSLQTANGEIVDPFGGDLTPGPAGPMRVRVDEASLILGDAGSLDGLFELLAQPGANYGVDVAGIATGELNEVRADVLVVRTLP